MTLLKIKPFFKAIRPRHWSKNLLIFVVPILAFNFDIQIWYYSFGSFIIFNFISSSIYLLNDCLDFDSDRKHHKKKYRPIASGEISRKKALFLSFILFLLSLYLSYKLNLSFFIIVLIYSLIQILYCIRLKNEPLLDIFCISSGFLLRSISGGISGGLFISPWFLLSVGLLALFLALEKRKAELRIFEKNGILTREVLKYYSIPLLLRLESIVSTGCFITYSFWASGPIFKGSSSFWMLLTVPLVLLGIFRYQYLSDPSLINKNNKKAYIDCENPVNILFKDNFIKATVIAWIFLVLIISLINNFS